MCLLQLYALFNALQSLSESCWWSTDAAMDRNWIINPRGAEGYGSCLVRICADLSVTTLTAA